MGVVIISTGTRSTQKQRRKVWITAATVCHRRRAPGTSFVFNLFRQIWRASIISSRVARVMRQRVMWAIVISVVRVLWAIVISVVRVEPGFSINVKALHRRPDPNCGLLRATSYHRDIYVFHNAHMVPPIFEGPGLEALCGETREVFGYDAYSALPRESSKPGDFFPEGLDPSAYLGAVAITEAFKERLYSGNLVAIPSLKQEVAVGQSASVRVPLYDKEVFPEGVPQLRQFYNSDLRLHARGAVHRAGAGAARPTGGQAGGAAGEAEPAGPGQGGQGGADSTARVPSTWG